MKNYDTIAQTDWARLAAYIDSEGCVQITWIHKATRKRGYHALYVDIGSIDVRLMSWLQNTFGGYANSTKSNANPFGKRQMFYWRCSAQMAEDVLRRTLPYMIVKREQAEVALQFRATFVGGHNTRELRGTVDQEREALRHKLSALKWNGVSRITQKMEPIPPTSIN